MKHISRYTVRALIVMLLSGVLAGCGAGAASESAGSTVVLEQSTQAAANPSMAPTNTIEPTQTVEPTQTAEPTQTVEPTQTAEPTQATLPTNTPLPTPSVAHQSHAAHADAPGATVQADIKLFMFRPDPLEIQSGATVVWTNQDDIDHSVTYGTPPNAGQAFDSDFFGQGKTFSFTFNEAGEYPYFCRRHPSMVGAVRVVGN